MRGLVAALLFLLPTFAMAADGLRLETVEGVYKSRHRIGFSGMPDERAENILEIVKISSGEAYVRAQLVFDNGHLCSFHGIAKVEGASLVYTAAVSHPIWIPETRSSKTVQGICRLSLTPNDKQIVFGDQDDVCTESRDPRVGCGARGLWRGAAFDRARRRPIRYMSRLLASREYAEAMRDREAK